jgi:hypothetical protein
MGFVMRGTRGDDATTAVRLRADTAVAKARRATSLLRAGRYSLSARMVSETTPMTSTICF